jgi:hypothetical protein
MNSLQQRRSIKETGVFKKTTGIEKGAFTKVQEYGRTGEHEHEAIHRLMASSLILIVQQ